MLALQVLVVAAAVSAADETVLLEFSADWCENCRSMAPTVERISAAGYPLRKINVDRERTLAQQFRVAGVPCYVMLAGGREVDRVTGATSYDRLLRMYQAAQTSLQPAAAPQIRGQSPDGNGAERLLPVPGKASFAGLLPPGAAPAANPAFNQVPATAQSPLGSAAGPAGFDPRAAMEAASQKALAATVRLRIEDSNGNSYGTGTVVDVHGQEALVLTCGHVFRDSQGKGRITADFFSGENRGSVDGHLIGYDLDRDIGLVSVRLTAPVAPMAVAPPGYRMQKGDAVFTLGCDKGGDPSVRSTYITSINKYMGSPNVEIKGAPIDGRSGGGLFSAEGYLIGVCNAADREGDEGLYASLPTVHAELDRTNLAFVYRRTEASNPASALATTTPAASETPPPSMPDRMPLNAAQPLPAAAAALSAAVAAPGAETEVICIVRSSDPRENARVIVLPKPSSEFMDRLAREHQTAELTSLRTAAGSSPIAGNMPAALENGPAAPVVRGQSPRN